tara:strand:- start:605 stop:733 length:129 start_codon:yes stop_codon:yes gene_type:complete
MKKIYNLILLCLGFTLLAHNSACVGFMQGALEEANRQIVTQE